MASRRSTGISSADALPQHFANPGFSLIIRRLRITLPVNVYREADVPERAAVVAAGGRVAIAGDRKAHATRDLIGTILDRFAEFRS